jgi:DNA-binding CsgD family transcriptional regulator
VSAPDRQELILKIHSCVLEPSRWSRVVEELAVAVEASAALLFAVPPAGSERFWNVAHNLDGMLPEVYAQHYVAHDEWLLGAQRKRRVATGLVSTDDQLVERKQFLKSFFCHEFAAPFGMDRFINVCLKTPRDAANTPEAALSFYRAPGGEAFSQEQAQLLRELSPHLALAFHNFRGARILALGSSVLAGMLDQVKACVYGIDVHGGLAYANRAGESDLTRAQWLSLEGGRLTASHRVREQVSVKQAFQRLLRGRASNLLLSTGGEHQALLMTAPAADRELPIAARVTGVVWVVPLEPDVSSVHRLSALFGLTAAEGRLLKRLALGENVQSVAQQLLVTENTVRSQLKSIFRKTGRRTQAHLLALLERMSVISPHADES